MKRYILFLLFLFSFYSISTAKELVNWHTEKSTHFIIYYKNATRDFVNRTIETSEDYYNKIADDLGFRRFDFWLWDNRAKIYIYDNALDYQSATGQPSWSGGCVLGKEKIIATFPKAERFFDTVLPHEMSHIIFRELVGFDNYAVPIWLDEGVACYQEKVKYAMVNSSLRKSMTKGDFMNLRDLSNFNPQLASNGSLASLFYAESFSIVNFLIREYGRDKFVFFCQNLRDRKNLERAIAATYPFSNIQELDQAWQEYLKNG